MKHPYMRDVETLDLLCTGLQFGFIQAAIKRIFENNPHLEPVSLSDKLRKWSDIKIDSQEKAFEMLGDVLGWDKDHFQGVYDYGIKSLYLFTPKNLALFFMTYNKSRLN